MKQFLLLDKNAEEVIGDFDSVFELNQFVIKEYIDKPYWVCGQGKMVYNENGYWLITEGGEANV